jgi:hypothetical protein
MVGTMAFLSKVIVSTRIAFARAEYVMLAAGVTAAFWVVFNVLDGLLFFDPVIAFYIPDDAAIRFTLSTVTSPLLGIVAAMNVYVFRNSKVKIGSASLFSGSSISVISSTCASCSSLGFFLVSTFGSAGVLASTIMSNYQIPLRLISVGLLLWALVAVSNRLANSCLVQYGSDLNTGENQEL